VTDIIERYFVTVAPGFSLLTIKYQHIWIDAQLKFG